MEIKGLIVAVSSIDDLIFAKTQVIPLRKKDQDDITELINLKKVNKNKGKITDPVFDGHLEKNISQMTPTERMDYLLM